MRLTAIIIGLFLAMGVFATGASLHKMGVRNARLLANHQRMITGNHLLDLNTGLPVSCSTDTDCYLKTGIDAGLEPMR